MKDRSIGDRLHLTRTGERLSLKAFGARVAEVEGREKPYKAATVSGWERGRTKVDVDTLLCAAKVGNVRAEWLILGTGQPQQAA